MNTDTTGMEYWDKLETPLGPMVIEADDQGLREVEFRVPPAGTPAANPITDRAKQQLKEYFLGQRRTFDLPLAPKGTAFQQQVWKALLTIPYGDIASYSDIARKLKNPNAVRAVGAANGKNPIAVIIPCHRVIGANGTLTGYAGGLERKAWLLHLEGGKENPQAGFESF